MDGRVPRSSMFQSEDTLVKRGLSIIEHSSDILGCGAKPSIKNKALVDMARVRDIGSSKFQDGLADTFDIHLQSSKPSSADFASLNDR